MGWAHDDLKRKRRCWTSDIWMIVIIEGCSLVVITWSSFFSSSVRALIRGEVVLFSIIVNMELFFMTLVVLMIILDSS